MGTMNTRLRAQLFGCAAALCFSATALADAGVMHKDTYKLAQAKIAAQRKADDQACARWKDHAKDVCKAEAEGRALVARAKLDAEYEPSLEAVQGTRNARAEADFGIAKERCDALREKPKKKACMAQARHDREAAERFAKVMKVESMNEAKAKAEKARKKALPPASVPVARAS